MKKVYKSIAITTAIAVLVIGFVFAPVEVKVAGVEAADLSKTYTVDWGPGGDYFRVGLQKFEDQNAEFVGWFNDVRDNYASSTAPSSPNEGQMWFESGDGIQGTMKVWQAATWANLYGFHDSNSVAWASTFYATAASINVATIGTLTTSNWTQDTATFNTADITVGNITTANITTANITTGNVTTLNALGLMVLANTTTSATAGTTVVPDITYVIFDNTTGTTINFLTEAAGGTTIECTEGRILIIKRDNATNNVTLNDNVTAGGNIYNGAAANRILADEYVVWGGMCITGNEWHELFFTDN